MLTDGREEAVDKAHLETLKLSVKITSTEYQSLLQLNTGKQQNLQGHKCVSEIKINLKELILTASRGGFLSNLRKKESKNYN